jgi:hypothetical protein
VVKYSASFAGEQLHSVTTTATKVLQSMRRLSIELARPARFTESGIRRKNNKSAARPQNKLFTGMSPAPQGRLAKTCAQWMRRRR